MVLGHRHQVGCPKCPQTTPNGRRRAAAAAEATALPPRAAALGALQTLAKGCVRAS